MKHLSIRSRKSIALTLALILTLTLGSSILLPAAAESALAYAEFHVSLEENLFLAKYGVEVLLDGQHLAYIQQGQELIFIASLGEGNHKLSFEPGKSTVKSVSWAIGAVQDGSILSCTLKTHIGSLELLSHTVQTGMLLTDSLHPARGAAQTHGFLPESLQIRQGD